MLKPINPTRWLADFGLAQAVEVRNCARLLFLSGQASQGPDGSVLHPGDLAAQVESALDNLECVLAAAGMSLANIARLNVYTTVPDELLLEWSLVATRLSAAGAQPACTYLGVARLAFPGMLVEFEATAAA
jgi:enamine deaminase RidA (YjgF/YER057c/UK114 family)